ncbi:34416_t:CDS:2, partial [Racocetra persica]
MASQIEDIFLDIETLIEFQLQDNIQNHSEVEQKFKDVFILISDIEVDDESQHGLYRYKYHTKYNSYLKTIGNMESANKQEKLAKNFEKYSNTHSEKMPFKILLEDVIVNQDCNRKDEKNEKVEEVNKQLKNEKVEEVNKQLKNEKVEEVSKPLKNEKVEEVNKPLKNEKVEEVNQPLKNEKVEEVSKPLKNEKVEEVSKPLKNEKVEEVSKPLKNEKVEEVNQPLKNEKVEEVNQPLKNKKVKEVNEQLKNEKVEEVNNLLKKFDELFESTSKSLINELTEPDLANKVIDGIKEIFEKLNRVITTFEGYGETIKYENYMCKLADNLISEKLIFLEASETSDDSIGVGKLNHKPSKVKNISTELLDCLKNLKSLARDVAYLKRTEFISFVSNYSNKRELLFGNVINTEEEINKRARVLGSYFHPDRTKNSCCPLGLQGVYKSQGDELFKLIFGLKEHLLNKLTNRCASEFEDDVNDYEKYGNDLWKITMDYHNASKGQWNKLRVLKEDDIKELSDEELKQESTYMGDLAYHQYRAACKIADKNKLLKRQVKLRGYMALCQYFVKKDFLTAQLYALAAIHLQIQNQNNFTLQELNEAKKIFDKVKGKGGEREKEKKYASPDLLDSSTDIELNSEFNNAMVLIGAKDQVISFNGIRIIRNSINKDLENIAFKLLVGADRSMVHYQSSHKEILRTTRHAKMYMAKGSVTMGGGGVGGAAAVIGASGPILLIAGAASIALGLYGGYLNAYDKGKYQEFINALSEEYDENNHISLIISRNKIKGIDDIVKKLIKHGFRSDGIAYLLVLLGEVIYSGKTKINGTYTDLKTQAKRCFEEALSDELVEEARKLDDCTSELRKTSKEHAEDSLEMPFYSRLEEIHNIARINIIILNITEFSRDAFEEATKIIKEIRESTIENHHFVSETEARLEALENVLWITSGENLPDKSLTFPAILPAATQLAQESNDKYINYLDNQLSFNQEKKPHNDKAIYLQHKAEKAAETNKLDSLRYWQRTQESYETAREMDPGNPNYSLGFARCLLNLSKYTQVIDLSDVCPVLNSSPEYWHYRSIAYFKHKKYKEVIICNAEALKLDPKSNFPDKYKKLAKKFDAENMIENRINNYKGELTYEMDYIKNSHSDLCSVFNILSIDGGGIRGVLPALLLNEMEYRTHRPISHLFNMIAGTSTGGIIAAGLSAPQFKINDYNEYEYSDLRPIFSASELLNIYKNDLEKLFTKGRSLFNITDKYTNEGRSTMFTKYFDKTRLSHSLTELVIPATYENYSTKSYLFTRYDARENEENDTFFDALMATTAAPTFFPPHKIKNKGTFLDGGIYLNNPALIAYEEAIRYKVANKKISVLSLGTGCYIPDPSMPDQYRDLLFWTQNHSTISVQEFDTDRKMFSRLGNLYQRWQIFFEEPIGFDDYKSIPNLLELGYQYIEELDFSDENPIN